MGSSFLCPWGRAGGGTDGRRLLGTVRILANAPLALETARETEPRAGCGRRPGGPLLSVVSVGGPAAAEEQHPSGCGMCGPEGDAFRGAGGPSRRGPATPLRSERPPRGQASPSPVLSRWVSGRDGAGASTRRPHKDVDTVLARATLSPEPQTRCQAHWQRGRTHFLAVVGLKPSAPRGGLPPPAR